MNTQSISFSSKKRKDGPIVNFDSSISRFEVDLSHFKNIKSVYEYLLFFLKGLWSKSILIHLNVAMIIELFLFGLCSSLDADFKEIWIWIHKFLCFWFFERSGSETQQLNIRTNFDRFNVAISELCTSIYS